MRTRLRAACIVWLFAITPGLARSDEVDSTEKALRPRELQAALVASRALLATQQQEREIARAAGLDGVEGEIAELRKAVRRLHAVEGNLPVVQGAADAAARQRSAAVSSQRGERRRAVLDSVGRVGRKRAAAAQRLGSLESARQRRIAARAVTLLERLEQETLAAVDAPATERAARLGALERRLTVERFGVSAEPGGHSTPTLQMLPESEIPPVEKLGTR